MHKSKLWCASKGTESLNSSAASLSLSSFYFIRKASNKWLTSQRERWYYGEKTWYFSIWLKLLQWIQAGLECQMLCKCTTHVHTCSWCAANVLSTRLLFQYHNNVRLYLCLLACEGWATKWSLQCWAQMSDLLKDKSENLNFNFLAATFLFRVRLGTFCWMSFPVFLSLVSCRVSTVDTLTMSKMSKHCEDALHCFPEPKVTYSCCSICRNNTPKPKNWREKKENPLRGWNCFSFALDKLLWWLVDDQNCCWIKWWSVLALKPINHPWIFCKPFCISSGSLKVLKTLG